MSGAPHAHCDHHHHTAEHRHRAPFAWGTVGDLCGLALLLALAVVSEAPTFEGPVSVFAQTFGTLVLESAPALLLGFAFAGVVPVLLTPARANSLARGGPVAQSLRGVAFGLPLPVCSCGVLPLYESLIRSGAPPVAALAFFVATPELGLDAILLSVPLLGPSLTAARIVAAFLVAVLVGLLVGWPRKPSSPEAGDTGPAFASPLTSGDGFRTALRFGFVEVFDHTMPWILLGLALAALAEPMLAHGALASIPSVLQVPLAAVVGVPVYVCASGATPVAALALHKGLSAGAAIAFLIAGPATNVTTFGVLARLHGAGLAVRFGASVTVVAVLLGWGVDALGIEASPVLDASGGGGEHASILAWGSAGVLVALTMLSIARQGAQGFLRQIAKPIHLH